MTAVRGIALGALAVAAVVVAVVLLSGGGGHTYVLRFQNAGQLVKDDDVQVGGRRVGSIRDITLADDNQAQITISVDDDFAPLHEGTTAVIRLTSLSGQANRYIALTPGPNNRPGLRDGATLTSEATTSPVDLDELFNTLDPKTRASLQQVIQGSAAQYQGKGRQANAAAKYFNPALSTSSRLVNEVTRDSQAFQDMLVSSSRVVTAIAERRDDLSALVSNAGTTAGAIGRESASLSQALDALPTTLRRANTTFVNLRATLDDLDTLVSASKPATKDLAPFLRELRPLVHDARPTIADLRTLITRRGADNDLIDLTRKTPKLESLAKPAFAHAIEAMRKSQPVLEFVRPYTPELVGWLRDFGQGGSNYDANGHFARVQPIFSAFSLTDNPAGGVLTTQPAQDRLNGLETGAIRRCPGAASQPAPDGSAPYRDSGGNLDCDPKLSLAGP
jgi:phospholipid/cholesterol/gamma-HCH transport system substrate-binding protein